MKTENVKTKLVNYSKKKLDKISCNREKDKENTAHQKSSSSESVESSSPTPMATLLPQILMSLGYNVQLCPHNLPVALGLTVMKAHRLQ